MKKIVLLTACLFTLNHVIQAQETQTSTTTKSVKKPETPEMRAQKSVDKLNSKVTLTEDQKPKVYALALARAKKVDDFRAKNKANPGTKEDNKKEMTAIRKEYRESIKAILTPAQVEALKAAKKNKPTKANGNPSAGDDSDDDLNDD